MRAFVALAYFVLCAVNPLRAENGSAAWLRYALIEDSNVREAYHRLPASTVALDSSLIEQTAQKEMIRGVRGMLGRTLRIDAKLPDEDCVLLGTLASVKRAAPDMLLPERLGDDAYLLRTTAAHGHQILLIAGGSDRGVLYGTFALLRKMALQQDLNHVDEQSAPYAPIRWTNEWDNLNGTIERGYAGRSIFFDNGKVVPDLTRAGEYARLLASIGIDGCAVNNVNANPIVLSSEFLPQLARIADVFRPWGVRLSISVDFGSPQSVGKLDTFDPVDPKVAAWWKNKVDEIYKLIPDLGGIVLKADSEGRVGPSTYGRSHADAANVIARALKPHGGVLVYRGFVYNHHMDWRDLKNDRARAAYDNFVKLDGKFDDNVLVQIKEGPIDFQVREPVSPLIAALKHTNETIEFQVTQEYTGQQRHLCFLLPMWEEVLNFDMRVDNQRTLVKNIVAGKSFNRPLGGFVAVTNVGVDQNWLGYDMAMANLYGFGRIAWDGDLSAPQIVNEWTRLTFGSNDRVVKTVNDLQLESWRVYEQYTGPLGVGGLTDIAGDAQHIYIGSHYGPGIESSERNGWGQWHRADKEGIGMDRTSATGTGYIGQYPPEVAAMYESLKTCPDNLLLFFHHVSYKYVLHSGKTVIQHVYDSHYEGAAEAQTFPERWRLLRGLVDEERFDAVLKKLQYQAGHAIVWRDTICNWFIHESGIPDAQGRVGHNPDRIEAEAMTLDGYRVTDVSPWEDASGKAITCPAEKCTAGTKFEGKPGWYNLVVQYFDQNNGISHFEAFVNGQSVGTWAADLRLPTFKPDSNSSTRQTIPELALRPGDEIRILGIPDQGEHAALDYIEIRPAP
ncbi:MAG TPA: alpha-glucuronidase family glycosyl hydrolase [Bryobacteraceae bacterium]|nr:alpha-glucuronidase family glycosyl hydrolase [Bryobacteraceae bacterium]